jgi:hypothetical protein
LPRIKFFSAKAGIKGPSEMMGFFICTAPFPRPILNSPGRVTGYSQN